jgi:hemerythrin-like domain-containing protein
MGSYDRRGFLGAMGLGGLALAVRPGAVAAAGVAPDEAQQQALLLSTVSEGIMYEHGLVSRLMSVYAECADRLEAGKEMPPGALLNAGALAGEFIEDYHEAFEEKFLYPLFGHAGVMVDLVAVMVRQHRIGRGLVERTVFLAGKSDLKAPDVGPALIRICRNYVRMYREHAARETTDVLPALPSAGGPDAYAQLHGQMMTYRHERLGGLDLADVREKLVAIEKSMGLENLDTFTAPQET